MAREMSVSVEEILRALQGEGEERKEGFAVVDLIRRTGLSPRTVENAVRRAVLMGRLKYVGYRIDYTVDGRRCARRPLYVVVKEGEGEKKEE